MCSVLDEYPVTVTYCILQGYFVRSLDQIIRVFDVNRRVKKGLDCTAVFGYHMAHYFLFDRCDKTAHLSSLFFIHGEPFKLLPI